MNQYISKNVFKRSALSIAAVTTFFKGLVRRTLLLGTTVLLSLSFSQMASAQDALPFSFGDMLAANGGPVQLPLGITATAIPVTTGTGAAGALHGETNQNPAIVGGTFAVGDTGFDEANSPIGLPIDATRINGENGALYDLGDTTGYADAIGFKVSFSSPIPTSYFYAMDIDGGPSVPEWKTTFAFNGTNFVAPTVSFSNNTNLISTVDTVDNTGWEADLPLASGQSVPSSVEIVDVQTRTVGAVGPADHENQVLFNYGNQPLTDIYFLFGRNGRVRRGGSNSGLSALFLNVPEFDVGKGSVAGPLQPDGTVDVTYTVTIENSGGVDFSGVGVEDVLSFPATIASPPAIVTPPTDVNSSGVTANSAWTGVAPHTNLLTANLNTLAVGDSFQIEFTVNTVATGSISNIANTSGEPVGFTGLFADDGSDPDTDADGNPDTVPNVPGGPGTPTIINLPTSAPSLTIAKVADSEGPHKAGDVVTYTYTITNDGNVNVNDVAISDTHNGSDPAPTPGNEGLLTDNAPLGDSIDAAVNGSWNVLAPGDAITFTGTYTVTQIDVDNL